MRVQPTVLLLLTMVSFFVRLTSLMAEPHPLGYDGYYYVTQLTRFAISGHLHSPESSWVIWLMVPARLLLGDSTIAVKLISSALAAICVPAAFGAVKSFAERFSDKHEMPPSSLAPWFAAVWAAGSPVLSLLAAEFPKNIGMIAPGLFLWAIWWREPKGKLHWLGLGLFSLLTLGAHRLGIIFVLLPIADTALGVFTHHKDTTGRKERKTGRVLPLVITATVAMFALLSYQLPNLLHPSDLQRLRGAFSAYPSFLPFAYFSLWSPSRALQFELVAGWPLMIFMGWGYIRTKKMRPLLMVFSAAFLLCNFPFWSTRHLDLGYRLGLLGPVFTLIPSFVILSLLQTNTKASWRTILVGAGTILAAGWICLSPFGIQTNRMPPYDRYKAMISLIPKPYPKKVIAHSGINFYYGHLTRHPAVAWAPLPSENPKEIFRIAWGISDGLWLEFLQHHHIQPPAIRLDPDYTYMSEDTWEKFVKWAKESHDEQLLELVDSPKNPHKTKPAFLQRNWKTHLRKTNP